jgi:hypothetical protein
MASDDQETPPYAGWGPFWTFIEELRASGHAPQVVDNTILGANRSGAARSQLLVALRFLGLVDGERHKTAKLDELVTTSDPKKVIGKLLLDCYGPVFDLNLNTATEAQVDKVLADMGAGTGDTLRRTRQFFIRAAQFSDLTLGPFLAKSSPSAPMKAARKRTRVKRAPAPERTPAATGGDEYSVDLSGGRVTVSVSVNLWELTKPERDFVIDLIDKLKGFRGDALPADDAAISVTPPVDTQ